MNSVDLVAEVVVEKKNILSAVGLQYSAWVLGVGWGWNLNQTVRVSVSCMLAAVHRQSA